MTTKFRTIQSIFNKASKRRNMMQTGTIVVRKAGTFIPNEYLEKVLAANPHGWGAALVDDGLQLNSADEGATLELIQETMKTFEKKDITFYFANSETGISMQDISPYVCVIKKDADDAEVPQIVAFVEGNFPTYAKKDSSHPAEYHMVSDYLLPKLENLYDVCDGDLNKVFTQMQKPFFQKELLLTSVSRGNITLVGANGASLTFAQNDLSAEYPWGWVSNTHGYATHSAKEEVKAEVKKQGMFPSRSTVREKANVQPSAKIAEAVKQPTSAGTIIKNYTVTKGRPPAHLSRADRKDWYKTRIGYLPPAWEKCCEIEFYNDAGKLLTFSQVKKMGLDAAGLPALKNPQRDARSDKDTDTDNIPHTEQNEPVKADKPVTAEILPIMSPETRKHIRALIEKPEVKKIIAENAEMIHDPKMVQSLEAKYADFAKQLGIKSIDEFLQWDYPMFLALAKERPDGLAVMAWTFRNIIAYHRTKKSAEEAPAETTTVKSKTPMFPSRKSAAA